MQNSLNVATLQAPGSLVGPQARLEWLTAAISELDTDNLDLVALPELFLTGYNIGEQVTLWAEERGGAYSKQIAALAQLHQVAIHFGYAEREGGQIYNSAACVDKTGTITGHHRKLLLPPGFESTYFAQGNSYSQFTIKGFRIATLICYDAEFPEAFRAVALAGCDLVVVPTALGAQWGVVSTCVVPARAFENGVYVCYANHCGEENGIGYYGGSCIVGPDGKDLARAARGAQTLTARLDVAEVKAARRRLPYHVDRLKLPGL